MIVDDFFQSSQVIKTYLGFDFYLAETHCDPYPYRVRLTKAGNPPTPQNSMGGFPAKDQQELQEILDSLDQHIRQIHLEACLKH